MYYLKGTFAKSFDPASKAQYCEIGEDLLVKRCVEEFWDGHIGYATAENPEGVGGVVLPEGEFPAETEIWSSEGEFKSETISPEEFSEIWEKAVAANA